MTVQIALPTGADLSGPTNIYHTNSGLNSKKCMGEFLKLTDERALEENCNLFKLKKVEISVLLIVEYLGIEDRLRGTRQFSGLLSPDRHTRAKLRSLLLYYLHIGGSTG